jgi:hypothetical protein
MLRASLLLVILALAGCPKEDVPSGDAGPPDDAGAPGDAAAARLVLGTGTDVFTPIPETGAELGLVYGPQGGWHLDAAVQLYGLEPDGLLLGYEIHDATTGENLGMPLTFRLQRRFVEQEGDHWVRVGDRAIFDIMSDAEVLGRVVELRATATRPEGTMAADARVLTVVAPM